MSEFLQFIPSQARERGPREHAPLTGRYPVNVPVPAFFSVPVSEGGERTPSAVAKRVAPASHLAFCAEFPDFDAEGYDEARRAR
jgi:hypothetical protein